jgi:hypothetical protein
MAARSLQRTRRLRVSRASLLLYKVMLEVTGKIKNKRRTRLFNGLHMQSLIGSTGLSCMSARYHYDRTFRSFDAMCRYVKVGTGGIVARCHAPWQSPTIAYLCSPHPPTRSFLHGCLSMLLKRGGAAIEVHHPMLCVILKRNQREGLPATLLSSSASFSTHHHEVVDYSMVKLVASTRLPYAEHMVQILELIISTLFPSFTPTSDQRHTQTTLSFYLAPNHFVVYYVPPDDGAFRMLPQADRPCLMVTERTP